MDLRHPPSATTAPAQQTPAEITAEACLRSFRMTGKWIYQRRDWPGQPDQHPPRYTRQRDRHRFREGVLAYWSLPDLSQYLLPAHTPSSQPTDKDRRVVPLGKLFGVFFEVDQPMDPLPIELASAGHAVAQTAVRYYDRLGRRIAVGTLTRTARIEGFEEVVCPAGTFERCLRVRVDLTVRFPLLMVIDWTTYVWLTPAAGEVRRVQQFTGWFLIFWFGSAQEYVLESYVLSPSSSSPPNDPAPANQWTRGLVTLDRGIPYPRISGLIIDF